MYSVNTQMEGGLNQNRLSALGEEMVIEKISRIFDDVKKEAEAQQSQPAGDKDRAQSSNLVDMGQQANDYSLDGRQKTSQVSSSPQKSQKRVKIALDEDDQQPEPIQTGSRTQPFQPAHPFVVPVIINQQHQNAHTGIEQGRGGSIEGMSAN